MMSKYRLTTLLLLCMMGVSTISTGQSEETSKVTIEMTYEDADGKKHSETIEYVGKEAEDFDPEAYEKSLEKRDIKILNLNINQSVTSTSKGEVKDVKIKQKAGKSKKSVMMKKIIVSDSDDVTIINQASDSDTYKVEEKDGKIFLNGKEVDGDKKQIRIMKTMSDDDEMKVEVKDGKVFINGEEVDESAIHNSLRHKVIIKKMGGDVDKNIWISDDGEIHDYDLKEVEMNIEVKDGKTFINGEEIETPSINKTSKHRVIIKKKDGETTKNIWISDDGEEHDLKDMDKMIFIADDAPQKPRLGIMIEDGKTVNGAEIVDLVDDSPASKAGLQKGDTVTSINDQPVYGVTSMMVEVENFKEGDEVTITYNRNGKVMTSKIKLEMIKTEIQNRVIIKE